MNIQKRIEAADEEIRKIRKLKEKVAEDMAPAKLKEKAVENMAPAMPATSVKDYVYIELLQIRMMNIDKRIEAVDQEIKKIRGLKEKVVEDMNPVDKSTNAPALPAKEKIILKLRNWLDQ